MASEGGFSVDLTWGQARTTNWAVSPGAFTDAYVTNLAAACLYRAVTG
jgi:hypothetical protein